MQRMEEIKSPLSASLEETVQGLPQAVEAVGAALAERYYVPLAEQSLPPEDGRPPESEGAELEQAVEAELESLRRASQRRRRAGGPPAGHAHGPGPEVVRPQSPRQRGH